MAAALVAALGVGASGAGAPALQIDWSINGGPVNQTLPAGEEIQGGGFSYVGTAVDRDTGVTLLFNLTAGPGSLLDGNVSIDNQFVDIVDVFIEVRLAVSPSPASVLAGSVAVGLTTDLEGGGLFSFPPFLWQALVDGSVVGPPASLFGHPFTLEHKGQQSSGAIGSFGTRDPVGVPLILRSLGYEVNFSISTNDVASFVSTLSAALGCPPDLNGDGVVDVVDLLALLGAWGACPGDPGPCPADFDGDGDVGTVDLLELLGKWGVCP